MSAAKHNIDNIKCEYLASDIYTVSATIDGIKWVETVTLPGVEAVLQAQNLKPNVRALYEAASSAIKKHNEPEPEKPAPEEKSKKMKGQGSYGVKEDFDE